MKYRLGDMVKVLNTNSVRSWYHADEVIGKVFPITELDNRNEELYILEDNKYCMNFTDMDLELVCIPSRECKKCKYRLRCITS